AVAFFALVDVLLLKVQSSWVTNFIGFKVTLLHVDKISLFVAYIFAIVGFLAILYTLHVGETWHHLLAFWYVGASFGAVFAGDLLSFYLFWELMVVGSTGLVLLNKKDPEAKHAAYRYLLMHLIGGAVLIGGIFLHYMNTRSLAVAPLDYSWASYLILFGVGMNSAWLLLHTWLPDAYPRALYTGSIFMAVYTTKTAVYALVRFAPGWDFVAYMGAAMAVLGVTMTLVQGNSRKLLSYSIVSQVGYMVAAIGLGGGLGVDGALFHLFNHILYKALLFMTVGAVIYRTGKDDLTEMGGVARKMPITTVCAVVASLSIAGVPLFNGFASKALIFQAADSNIVIEMMLELAAVGTFLSFFKFTYFGFIRPNKNIEAKVTEAPWNMTVAMGCTAALCFIIGVAPYLAIPYLPFALPAAETNIYVLSRVLGVMQLMVVSGLLFFLALPVFAPHKCRTYDFDWFYAQIGKGLQVVAEGFSRTNNAFERALSRIVPAIMSLKPAIYKLNELAARLLFAVFVDMWLFKPVTQAVTKLKADEAAENKKDTHVIENLARLGERTSFWVGKIDIKIIDRLIDQFAMLGERLSHFTGFFDLNVVDGIVNGVGTITQKAGKRLRPFQTGDVQTYGVVMIGGAFFALVFFALVFYGVLSVS
ncbi:MAG: proton-conducting transporter membrane subunit, partial [Actinomycetota bacterium]|nr:proton-conducting transporter membrane subunit [Actinomycetota bacterium]